MVSNSSNRFLKLFQSLRNSISGIYLKSFDMSLKLREFAVIRFSSEIAGTPFETDFQILQSLQGEL
jgi:hypothetical protein